jgi:hypothetical protein
LSAALQHLPYQDNDHHLQCPRCHLHIANFF